MSHSPAEGKRREAYERGWEALNRLLRRHGSFSGHERNHLYVNDGTGSFADASGVSGLDFADDGRAFAVFDFDSDGDLDLALKSRSRPQLRLLRNDAADGRPSLRVRLEGRGGNRNAVGARVEVHAEGGVRKRSVRAGSGYLSQHSRTLHFGLDGLGAVERIVVHWPGGATQTFEDPPSAGLVSLIEGEPTVETAAFRAPAPAPSPAAPSLGPVLDEPGTWLLDPIRAPDVELRSIDGATHRSSALRGKKWLLNFWATWCAPCRQELRDLDENRERLERAGVEILAVSVDEPPAEPAVRRFRDELGLELPLLLATTELIGVWDTLSRHLFDYMTELAIPTSFLVDESGDIVKVY